MPPFLFYLFSAVAVLGALGVVINRNPVSGAFSMVGSFLGVAALFIGLNAYFIGIIQILVYAGAIMVLFLFIIMLLDLKAEKGKKFRYSTVWTGAIVAFAFAGLAGVVLGKYTEGNEPMPPLTPQIVATGEGTAADAAAVPRRDDVKDLGKVLFTEFNFPLQIMGVLLLVATVGVVVLSKKELT